MNILLVISSPGGGLDYLAFELECLSFDLEKYTLINNAIVFAIEEERKPFGERVDRKVFSKEHGLVVSYGEIWNEDDFIADVLRAEAIYGDPEAEEYDPRYRNLSLQPPFHIDAVLKVRTFE